MSRGDRLLRVALVALLALQEPALCLAQSTQAPGVADVPAGPRLTDEERRALEARRRPARETPDERARREAAERWHRESRELEERQPIRERNLREAALGLKPVLQERADGSTSAVTGDLWNVLERATLERALARQGLALAAQARLREQLRRAVAARRGSAQADLERALGGPRAKRRGCRLHHRRHGSARGCRRVAAGRQRHLEHSRGRYRRGCWTRLARAQQSCSHRLHERVRGLARRVHRQCRCRVGPHRGRRDGGDPARMGGCRYGNHSGYRGGLGRKAGYGIRSRRIRSQARGVSSAEPGYGPRRAGRPLGRGRPTPPAGSRRSAAPARYRLRHHPAPAADSAIAPARCAAAPDHTFSAASHGPQTDGKAPAGSRPEPRPEDWHLPHLRRHFHAVTQRRWSVHAMRGAGGIPAQLRRFHEDEPGVRQAAVKRKAGLSPRSPSWLLCAQPGAEREEGPLDPEFGSSRRRNI